MKHFKLLGGNLAIHFANSTYAGSSDGDPLADWAALIAFLGQAGVISSEQRERLVELSSVALESTAQVFRVAVELRSAIRRILEAMVGRSPILPKNLEPINSVLRWTEGFDQIVPTADGRWRLLFVERQKRLEWLLAAIARSAAELVAEGPDAPVRKCANPKCVLYFYDTSRTGQRRWCSMAVCGNRNKVAEFARRHRRPKRRGKKAEDATPSD